MPSLLSRAPRAVRRLSAMAVALLLATTATVAAVQPAAAADPVPCTTGGNAVVCENAKPGTSPSIWDITGSGDPSIQGFSTDISVNVGSSVDFKIDTTATDYAIDVYRTGWYQGLGARHIASVTPSAVLPQVQPQCVSDLTTELYDCGNWGVSATWDVPTDAVSGVYVATLTRHDTGGKSQITFVVRDRASTADVLFQTSDPTWQAYNTYGGSDFYQGAANGRAYKVSYNRPVSTRGELDGRDFYFSSEYAQVRFMEKNGYDVTYASGVDTDRFGSDLLKHQVFLSVGHDEYWSTGQRKNIEAARDAGVDIQFLSGNDGYWHTRYEDSADGRTAYRTLVTFKDTWADRKIDSASTWTGTWRDPRFASTDDGGGKPENSLIGTMFMANNSDLAITVSSAEGKTRLWRNTSLANLAAGSSQALAAHTIGYESNEDVDNGFRPSGLIHLSTTTGAVEQYLQDFGKDVAPGVSTHHLTLYRAASGALVFSAGSIQWAWGLDQTHDGQGAAADIRMQQAQVNLLADMGAQPMTLAGDLVAATASDDTTAPTVSITSPTAGSAVASGAAVTVAGTASDVGGIVAGVQVSTDGGTTWHATTGTTSWSYTFEQGDAGTQSVRIRAVDDSANYAATPATVSYTVGGPFTVFGSEEPKTTDSGDSSSVELGLRFTATTDGYISGVRFYKSAANTGLHTGSLWNAAGQRLAKVAFDDETATGWQTAWFASSVHVTAGDGYTVSYNAPNGHYSAGSFYWAYPSASQTPMAIDTGFGAAPGVYNTNGDFPTNSYNAANYFVDAIFTASDISALSATNVWPAADSSSVPLTTRISTVLSRDVVPSSVKFAVIDQNGQAVAGSSTYDASTRTATFAPASALSGFVKYTVKVKATDAQGVPVTTGATWSFTTVKPAAAEGVCPCSIYDDSTTPGMLDSNDPKAVTLGVRFTPTKDGTVTGAKFYKAAVNTGTHVATLWSPTGTALATATFTAESSSGWQSVAFADPIAVSKNVTYTVSYRTEVGHYSATLGAYDTGFTRGPLAVPARAGVYSYADQWPQTSVPTGYLVDVEFTAPADPLAVTAQTPASGAVSVDRGANVSIELSAAVVDGYAVSVASGGAAVAGTTTVSPDRRTITFDPTAELPNEAAVQVSVTGLATAQHATLPTQSWSFTTADTSGATATSYTLFGSESPAVAAADDSSSVELGVSFTPASDGSVTAIRFYKGAGNTGIHVGSLWNSSGTRIATVTFTGETATGWQSAALASPVALTAGQRYVVSYLAPVGHYSYTGGYFSSAKASGPLTAGSSGNGLYLYGQGGSVPRYSYGAANYFVDVTYSVPKSTSTPTPAPTPNPTPPNSGNTASLFAADATPANAAWNDPDAVQVGVRFTPAVNGQISGIRFYKGDGNTGTHRVYLWAADGTQLATAVATTETATGWQTVTFDAPVAVTAGGVYRASYLAPNGHYAVDIRGLSSPVVNGSLSTIADGGVYTYGSGAPDSVVAHNYWVDVAFSPSA